MVQQWSEQQAGYFRVQFRSILPGVAFASMIIDNDATTSCTHRPATNGGTRRHHLTRAVTESRSDGNNDTRQWSLSLPALFSLSLPGRAQGTLDVARRLITTRRSLGSTASPGPACHRPDLQPSNCQQHACAAQTHARAVKGFIREVHKRGGVDCPDGADRVGGGGHVQAATPASRSLRSHAATNK